jgi:hypothetical protein
LTIKTSTSSEDKLLLRRNLFSDDVDVLIVKCTVKEEAYLQMM